MEVKYTEFKFQSIVKGQSIFTRLYEPVTRGDEPGKAILQIIHGMAEHSGLYDELCRYLASEGYIVVLDDHLGHGRSVSSGDEYGYFFDGGINNLVRDERTLHNMMAEKYPDLPYFMMGHSMGSFILRDYIARFRDPLCGVIIMGTAGPMGKAMWAAEKAVLTPIIAQKGPKAKIRQIADIATGGYTKAFPESPAAWVTSDKAESYRYEKDPMCGFQMTVSAYKEIGALIQKINSKEWFEQVPKKLPILMLSGINDAVGGMGKGVRKVAANLVKTEHDVDLILYPQVRHALVNEVNKEQVFTDIRNFIEYKTIRHRIAKRKKN